MNNFFSKNLKYLRIKKGLSQNKLADLIDVNQTTIARWEDDNRTPIIDNAIDISNALNIPLPDLLGKDLSLEEDEQKVIPKQELKRRINAFKNDGIEISYDPNIPVTEKTFLEAMDALYKIRDQHNNKK